MAYSTQLLFLTLWFVRQLWLCWAWLQVLVCSTLFLCFETGSHPGAYSSHDRWQTWRRPCQTTHAHFSWQVPNVPLVKIGPKANALSMGWGISSYSSGNHCKVVWQRAEECDSVNSEDSYDPLLWPHLCSHRAGNGLQQRWWLLEQYNGGVQSSRAWGRQSGFECWLCVC